MPPTKLKPENAKSTSKIMNYIPHHAVFDINKQRLNFAK